MSIKSLWYSLLERLHLLHVVVDIGEELRLLEIISIGPWKRIVHTHSEALYDEHRLVFSVQRFLEKYATHSVQRVHLAVSRLSVMSQFLPLPDIPKEKLSQLVEWQLSKLLHLSPQDVVIGYNILSRTHFSGSPGWNILAAVMKKGDLHLFHEIIQEAHLLPYEIVFIGHVPLLPYLPPRSDQAEGIVVWQGHRMLMAIVERGEIVQYQYQLLPENRHLPTELKQISQFFSEYIKLGGNYLVKIHLKALSEEEETFFLEGILESINILAERAEILSRYFRKVPIPDSYMDMYALFTPVGKSYRIGFPLPSQMGYRRLWDGIVQWGAVLCTLLVVVALLLSPWMLFTHAQYSLYKKAEEILATGQAVQNEALEKRVEEVRLLQTLRQYQQEKSRYEQLLAEAKSVSIESSNLKMVLVSLSQALPPDVRLEKLSFQKGKGEMVGEAKSSKGLQNFVKALLDSPYLSGISIAEVKRSEARTVVEFRILFEVRL